MNCKLLSLFLASAAVVITQARAGEQSINDQVKALGRRYEQVEEQLPRSVMYSKTDEAAGEKSVTRAWFNGVGDLLKFSVERSGPAGRELTESIALGGEVSWDGMFLLNRKEIPSPDGGTQVEEARRYFGDASARGEESGGN